MRVSPRRGPRWHSPGLMVDIILCLPPNPQSPILCHKNSLKKLKLAFFQNPDDLHEFESLNILQSITKTVLINGSGVDLKKYKTTPLPRKITFLMVSRLIKHKGIIEYIESAKIVKKENPAIDFLLIGGFDDNPSSITKRDIDLLDRQGVVKYLGWQKNVVSYKTTS